MRRQVRFIDIIQMEPGLKSSNNEWNHDLKVLMT
jgi:hypothetical protein